MDEVGWDNSELLDVVDETDRVVHQATRRFVHDNYLIHRGVHVFVTNRSGELLLQRRSTKKRDYPGYWDISVGGQVASGESYDQAASRELHEELGCHLGPLRSLGMYDAFSERQREKRKVFRHDCSGPFTINRGEVDAIEWVNADELAERLRMEKVTEGLCRSLELYWHRLKHPDSGWS